MSARGPAPAPAQLAKAALRRLALAQAEPTPENYARAYDEELGIAPRPVLPARSRAALERMAAALLRDEVQRAALVEAFVSAQPGLVERIVARVAADEANQAQALAGLFRGLVRGLERADRHWTLARKKEGLRGIFESSHGDAQRLQQRLSQLVAAWERDTPPNTAPAELPDAAPPPAADAPVGGDGFLATLGGALSRALPTDDASGRTLARCCSSSGNSAAHTGRFSDSVARYADVIDHADSLQSLAGVVREMVTESRTVQGLVGAAQQRLQDEQTLAIDLSQRVKALEDELRHLSDEMSTDPLTQIANRRGLLRAFEAERACVERSGRPLALGLLDVDDFKRLNDRLGHGAGDAALKSLAARVQDSLRPNDVVARYGGEEFVLLLPATPLAEAQLVLSRMQRATTEALFLHESTPVFVTFSAGVTLYRAGERLEDALDRADLALYEAKRTGKNRSCTA